MQNFLVDVSENLAASPDVIIALPPQGIRYNAAAQGEQPIIVVDYIVEDDAVTMPPGCVYACKWDGATEPEVLLPLTTGLVRKHVFAGWP